MELKNVLPATIHVLRVMDLHHLTVFHAPQFQPLTEI